MGHRWRDKERWLARKVQRAELKTLTLKA